jgi:hypothetical protein
METVRMNITFSNLNQVDSTQPSDHVEHSGDENTGRLRSAGRSSQLSGVIFGQNQAMDQAYAEKGKSQNEIASMADGTDLETAHNYDTLMANGMTDADYTKASEDGYDLKDENSEAAVNIIDKIKAVLVESGTQIAGFTDDLSREQLTEITGSQAYANELVQSFHENDVPITEENVAAVQDAVNRADTLEQPTASAAGYMIENRMDPTIDHLYFASYSTNGQSTSGSGFYAQETGGYYARKADQTDWEQITPQINRVISKAGYTAENAAVQTQAKSLISSGIPLTADNLRRGMEIQSLTFPLNRADVVSAAVSAIADGKEATQGNLADPRSQVQKAADLNEAVQGIGDRAVQATVTEGKELNLKNLLQAAQLPENGQNKITEDIENTSVETAANSDNAAEYNDINVINARKQLEEVRLIMSTQTNLKLLKSGYQIDTAPMEDLIGQLKTAAAQLQGGLFTSGSGTAQGESLSVSVTVSQQMEIYAEAAQKISFMPQIPAAIVGALKDEFKVDTLDEIYVKGTQLQLTYDKAGDLYEALMTAPRADLGDRMEKAFQNVDDLLSEIGQDTTQENRRAVRILAYNQMSVTSENVEQVRAWDNKLTTAVDRLKPAAVLSMIRDGQNPLSMTIDELNQNLDERNSSDTKQDEKYAKFLYKLEKQSDITSEEKESYIGIYRLFNTLQKTDDAAIGTLLNTGAEMTIGNLLSATRTLRSAGTGMDYTVDDSFGGLQAGQSNVPTISQQIESAFIYYSAKADTVSENMEPEKLKAYGPSETTELAEFADALKTTDIDERLEKSWNSSQLKEIRDTFSAQEKVQAQQELQANDIPVSIGYLQAVEGMLSSRKINGTSIWDRYGELAGDEDSEQSGATAGHLTQALEGSEDYHSSYKEDLQQMTDQLSKVISDTDVTYIDMKAISLMHKQLAVAQEMADHGSYEIPVQVGGQTVSMHVVLQKDEGEGSGVEASLETQDYGTLSVSMRIRNGKVSGLLKTDHGETPQTRSYCETVRARLSENISGQLPQLSFDENDMAVIYGSKSNGAIAGSEEKASDQALLSLARAFVTAI